jgi:hypothetical protein
MAEIYVSYKRADRSRIAPIIGALQAQGFTLWFDADLSGSSSFNAQIEREIMAAQCVLVLLSVASSKSEWVRAEARLGLRESKLIPVLLEDVQIPEDFNHIVCADLRSWHGDINDRQFQDLLRGIERLVQRAPDAPPDDVAAWQIAQATNTRSAYEEFSKEFPNSTFAQEATRRLSGPSSQAQRGRVFLSYRRDDTQAVARLIYDKLTPKIGRENVFFDVSSIPMGVTFDEFVRDQLVQCSTLLAIIGGTWLGRRQWGASRIRSKNDWVRRELELAFRQRLRVIPIVVVPHKMPDASELPRELKRLPSIQFAELSLGKDYETHVDRIVAAVSEQ